MTMKLVHWSLMGERLLTFIWYMRLKGPPYMQV